MKHIGRMIDPLKRRIMMMAARGIVRIVNDGLKLQAIQATFMANETRNNLEHFQQYGFTHHPKPGAECVAIFLGGNRDHGIIISVDDRRYRLVGLQEGEVALYTDEGDSVILKRGKNMELNTNTLTVNAAIKARFNTPILECTGDIIDKVDTNLRSMRTMRTVYNTHTHPETQTTTQQPNQQM